MKIETEAEEGEGGLIFSGDGLNQEACKFSVLQKKIVGPLQRGFQTGEGADGIGGREGAEEGEKRKMGGGGLEKEGDPEAEGFFRDPGFASPAVAGGLGLGGENGGGRGEGCAKVVLGGGEGGNDGRAVAERGGGGEEEVDLSGLEGIGGVGRVLPEGGVRGRNCRRS